MNKNESRVIIVYTSSTFIDAVDNRKGNQKNSMKALGAGEGSETGGLE